MTLCAWCACRWVDELCHQLIFFCEKLQQVKSLSQAHLSKASPVLVISFRTHYADSSRFAVCCSRCCLLLIPSRPS